MSTIFGLFNQDLNPVRENTANHMTAVMNHWHADESGKFLQQEIFLGHLMLFNTPESLNEKLPFQRDELCITADARIDNRDDILKLLEGFKEISFNTPDAYLILALYVKFGKDCLRHIVGDFCFAIWDAAKKELFCARDHLGIKPFYYYARNSLFAFASERKGILAIEELDHSLNEDFIYRLIGDADPAPTETFHKYIQILLPAHFLIATPEGITISRYWELSIPPILKLSSPEDYIAAFREQLSIAVKCRLRSIYPISTELSGGLDSSGITGLAARLITDKSKHFTFSNVLPGNESCPKPFEDEEKFIDEVIRFCGIRNAVKVSESGWKHFLEPHELELFANSGVDMYNSFWQEPIRRKMEENGIRVTLSGFSGDEVITNRGTYFFYDLLDEKKYVEFIKISFHLGYYGLPLKMLLRNILPQSLKRFLKQDQKKPYRRVNFLVDTKMNTAFEAEIKNQQHSGSRSYKKLLIENITRPYTFQRYQSEAAYCIMHKLEPRFPYADIRLINFFLSLPTELIGHPGISRYIYRKSMEGIIPESVRLRDDKSGAAGIFFIPEFHQNAPLFRHWLREIAEKPGNAIISKIDLQKMIAGYDPENPENFREDKFIPRKSFKTECLLHYFCQNKGPVIFKNLYIKN